eukprot:250661-Amphidinium_carterae.3
MQRGARALAHQSGPWYCLCATAAMGVQCQHPREHLVWRTLQHSQDLALLKSGDQTRVGEKGTSLSGGQKARVCLARAAYKLDSSHIFLLDDPYSALDAHVAASVHEDVVLKLLAKRTRIVATNRLEFLTNCDLVIVLDG